jgi:Ser/Thr protein kinase RdoA (MazF antagonist)
MLPAEAKELDESREALAEFGDFGLALIGPYRHGFSTQKFLVTSADGRFILRRLDGALPLERVQFIAASQKHLWKCGLAPQLVATRDGLLNCRQGTWWYLLSKFLPGTAGLSHVFSPAIAGAMGSLLGYAHSRYRMFALAGNGVRCLHFERKPRETLEQLAILHAQTNRDSDCIRIIQGKLVKLRAFNEALLNGVHRLPQQVVHGDYYVENVVFNECCKVAGLIDFDQSCLFYRCYEVLRGIMTSILHVHESLRLECLRMYLSAYCDVIELTSQEIVSMLPFYYFVLLGNPFGLEYIKQPGRNYANLREFAVYRWQLAQWIDDSFGELQEVISQTVPLYGRNV